MLEDTDLLKGLDDLAVDGAGGIDVVVGAGATVLDGAVDLAEAANTNGLAEVDVTSDGSGTDVVPSNCQMCRQRKNDIVGSVVPVSVLGRELVGARGLDSVNPSCTNYQFPIDHETSSVEVTHQGWGAFPDASRTQSKQR